MASGYFYDATLEDQTRRLLECERDGLSRLINEHSAAVEAASRANTKVHDLCALIHVQKELIDKLELWANG